MKLDTKKLLNALQPALELLQKYRNILVIVLAVGVFGFIFYRIGYFNSLEPTESQIEEKLLTVQRPKIDKSVVEKLEMLEHQNIQVQSLFNQARENPFRE